jgi:hypothetical protein
MAGNGGYLTFGGICRKAGTRLAARRPEDCATSRSVSKGSQGRVPLPLKASRSASRTRRNWQYVFRFWVRGMTSRLLFSFVRFCMILYSTSNVSDTS